MKPNRFNKAAETVDTYPYSPPSRSMFSPQEKGQNDRGISVSLPEKPKAIDVKPISASKEGVKVPQNGKKP